MSALQQAHKMNYLLIVCLILFTMTFEHKREVVLTGRRGHKWLAGLASVPNMAPRLWWDPLAEGPQAGSGGGGRFLSPTVGW